VLPPCADLKRDTETFPQMLADAAAKIGGEQRKVDKTAVFDYDRD